MKRIIFMFLSILLFFTASGCKRKIKLIDSNPTITNKTKIGRKIKKTDLSFNDVTYKKMLDEVLNKIIEAKDAEEFYDAYYSILGKTNELVKKYAYADALCYLDPYNDKYIDAYEILNDSYYYYVSFYNKTICEISGNDEFLETLFPGYSDEDIDYVVNMALKKQDEKYIELEKELDELKNEADLIGIDVSSSKDDDKLLDVMYRFINKNKELASFLGFDSYVEYADLNYNRSYTKTDLDNFINNAKTYILPLMDDNCSVISISDITKNLSRGEYNYFVELNDSSIFDKDYYTYNLVDSYAKKIGGSYYTTYRDFFNDGTYIFANYMDSVSTGYTNNYLSYFGPGCQDALTFVHEFGHFFSDNNPLLATKSLDLKEFYSQADEFLFMAYLENTSAKYLEKVYDASTKYNLSKACKAIIVASAVREFEELIYNTTLKSKEDIKTIWDNINTTKYNSKLSNYWKVEIRYDLYFISYATSATGAIGLYCNAKNDMNASINSYLKAVNNSEIDDDINEVLEKSGISSPFSTETFIKITDLIKEKR